MSRAATRLVSIALMVAALLLLVGCWSQVPAATRPASPVARGAPAAPRAETPAPSASSLLRLLGADPDTLDPALVQDVTSWGYLLQLFSGLVALDNELQVVPDIAKDWQVDPSRTVYTFKIRPDVKFHDGRTVSADDVKYSLERATNPKLASGTASVYLGDILGVSDKLAGKAGEIAGVRALDQNTVQITIDAPKPYFLAKLTYPTAFIVDRNNVQSTPDWWRHPNGTGPFKLKSWQTNATLVIEANGDYYGGRPTVDQVSYFLGAGSPVAMYERGDLDVVQVGSADIDRVSDPASKLNKELSVEPQLDLWYLGFNVDAKPFDDPKVRQAFHYATDKQRIVEVMLNGTKAKAEGILPPGIAGYDATFRGPAFDAEKAKELLRLSSYGSAEKMPPITLTMGAGAGTMGQNIAQMYQNALGVQINVEQAQAGFFNSLAARQFQMFYLGWVADYPDPQDFLDILFHSHSEGNHTGYSNPKLDGLLEQARTERDQQKRWQLYQQAERIVVDDSPVVPIFHDVDHVLVKPDVRGLVWTSVGPLSLRGVEVLGQRKPGTL